MLNVVELWSLILCINSLLGGKLDIIDYSIFIIDDVIMAEGLTCGSSCCHLIVLLLIIYQ